MQEGGSITTRMMDVVSENFVPLLQLMSVDLQGTFNTGLIKTKCLNTAVLVTYLSAGREGLKQAFTCNVNKVIPRYTDVFNKSSFNNSNYSKFAVEISGVKPPRPGMLFKQELAEKYRSRMVKELDAIENKGRLHYIMLTDFEMNAPSGDPKDMKTFPGHVFTIDHRADNSYHLYQSYINAYDMETQVKSFSSGSTLRSKAWMKRFCRGLEHFISVDKWDRECAGFWSFLTHTDATKFVGLDKSGIYLCHNSVPTRDAIDHFNEYISEKHRELERHVKTIPGSRDKVYGDMSLYAAGSRAHKEQHRSSPLTAGQLLDFLKGVLDGALPHDPARAAALDRP